jgi:2-enoate reductase
VSEVTATSVKAKKKDGTIVEIPADSVIMSVGYIPTPLVTKADKVSLVGDCNGIGNLRTVIWRAYDVAMKI